MFNITIKKFALFTLLLSIFTACSSGSAATSSPPSPTSPPATQEPQIELLTLDNPIIDSNAIYTFENPGNWIIYQGHLSTDDQVVNIFTYPQVGYSDTFEEYIASWINEELEVVETEDGVMYASGVIGDTQSIFVQTPEDIRWTFQMSLADADNTDLDLDDFSDDLMQIALSATYTVRETGETDSDED